MFKRFSKFFACVLLVLMPLQGFAAASMRICNGMMPAQVVPSAHQAAHSMPCHEPEKSLSAVSAQLDKKHAHSCKASCAALCASLCAMTALSSNVAPFVLPLSTQAVSILHQSYTSIALASLQRPPIRLS
jgi:hypothetical protein